MARHSGNKLKLNGGPGSSDPGDFKRFKRNFRIIVVFKDENVQIQIIFLLNFVYLFIFNFKKTTKIGSNKRLH